MIWKCQVIIIQVNLKSIISNESLWLHKRVELKTGYESINQVKQRKFIIQSSHLRSETFKSVKKSELKISTQDNYILHVLVSQWVTKVTGMIQPYEFMWRVLFKVRVQRDRPNADKRNKHTQHKIKNTKVHIRSCDCEKVYRSWNLTPQIKVHV